MQTTEQRSALARKLLIVGTTLIAVLLMSGCDPSGLMPQSSCSNFLMGIFKSWDNTGLACPVPIKGPGTFH